jgi:hypothetical protein
VLPLVVVHQQLQVVLVGLLEWGTVQKLLLLQLLLLPVVVVVVTAAAAATAAVLRVLWEWASAVVTLATAAAAAGDTASTAEALLIRKAPQEEEVGQSRPAARASAAKDISRCRGSSSSSKGHSLRPGGLKDQVLLRDMAWNCMNCTRKELQAAATDVTLAMAVRSCLSMSLISILRRSTSC